MGETNSSFLSIDGCTIALQLEVGPFKFPPSNLVSPLVFILYAGLVKLLEYLIIGIMLGNRKFKVKWPICCKIEINISVHRETEFCKCSTETQTMSKIKTLSKYKQTWKSFTSNVNKQRNHHLMYTLPSYVKI